MARQFSLFLMSLVLLVGVADADEGDSLWSRTYGGSDWDAASSIVPSGDGGYLLAGCTTSFGSGDYDMWIVKTNSQGDSLWSRTYGGADDEIAYSLIKTADGGYLLAGSTRSFGSGESDMWMVKTNSLGDSLWSATFGGDVPEEALSVISTSDGGYLLAGTRNDTIGGPWTNINIWIVKTDSLGDSVWSRTFGEIGLDRAYSAIQTSDGGYMLAGLAESFGAIQYDMLLLKIDSQGDSLWCRTFGGTFSESAHQVIETSDGGYLLAGHCTSYGAGFIDMWIVKTNSQGDSLWSRTFGGIQSDWAYSVIETSDGGFLLAGQSESFGSGGFDMWVGKTDSVGDSLRSHTFGGIQLDEAYSLIQNSDGEYLVAGYTSSFGAGGRDMWLVCVEGPGVAVDPEFPPVHPSSFRLHPCHPNPFNPATVLTFDLPVASLVKLEVFDINGRNVGARRASPLLSGSEATPTMYPSGTHNIAFDGSGLPSGIYLARLTAGDWQQTQKLILLK